MDIYSPTKPVYYVYFYLREDNTPYYVGKGKGKRAYVHSKNEIQPPRDKSRIIIIQDNLTELQSFILERYYIRWFGRKDNNTGILRNRTDGGDGTSGQVVTEETKQKLSLANKGKTRTFSEEHKKNMSLAKKGTTYQKGRTHSGRTHSEEHKKKLSLARKGKPKPSIHPNPLNQSPSV